ncbi:MAG: DEAD/DEAH box helicase family protein, partial [Bacteroidales bacterium]|nr:DEAD/DEAH box helicase family protein [Bacteroidales bacterium]
MSMFLHQLLDKQAHQTKIKEQTLSKELQRNLNAKFELRNYQTEALKRLCYYLNPAIELEQSLPYHLNFNMATGSGKTLLMAAIMIYLYEKGYRKFLFFVNSTTILDKTKDNFLNQASSKYLFAKQVFIQNKRVEIREVSNFDEANEKHINILFTSIQKLHSDLNSPSENGISTEDFNQHKVVFIADEAHHINVSTKKAAQVAEENWESTVLQIHGRNKENLLLEFTATLELKHKEIAQKYADKIIYQYDLKQFRQQAYSKEIQLVQTNKTTTERILQAITINQYKQDLALDNGINLKPVILFKEQRSIKESELNKDKFHHLIDNLTIAQLSLIIENSKLGILQKAYEYYTDINLLLKRLQTNFAENHCLSANNDAEKGLNQTLLNSLEDAENPIRAIFAVQKLNEGWDVLNLFDIVRMNEKPSTSVNSTISEAQLIGRGARYFPFTTKAHQNKYTRKFDTEAKHPLRILEELHYYTISDNQFIKQLKTNLLEIGLLADKYEAIKPKSRTKFIKENLPKIIKPFVYQYK